MGEERKVAAIGRGLLPPVDARCRLIEISIAGSEIPEVDDGDGYSPAQLDWITGHAVEQGARRGDVIVLVEQAGYRNHGKLLFDGERAIELCRDIDDDGAVPPTFPVLDDRDGFSIRYWANAIIHNTIVWFTPNAQQLAELQQNIVREMATFGRGAEDDGVLYTWCTHHGDRVFVVSDCDGHATVDVERVAFGRALALRAARRESISWEHDNNVVRVQNNDNKHVLYLFYNPERDRL